MANDVVKELPPVPLEREGLHKLWQAIDISWLKKYYSSQLSARTLHEVREQPYSALSRLGAENVERKVAPGHFLIASASPEKLRLISEIVQEKGGITEPIAFVDEESQKEFAQSVTKGWIKESYPLAVASGKALDVHSQAFETGKTIVSADSVVISPNNQILEKPKDEADLMRMLKQVRGKKIKVMVGVNTFVPLRYGQVAVRINEGAKITVKLRNLTEEEVVSYVGTAKDQAMEVSGGIDFASKLGQSLVDQDLPITVEPLRGTVYALFFSNKDVTRRPVMVDPKNIDLLAPYFKGVPKEIIGVLMEQSKDFQEKVERL